MMDPRFPPPIDEVVIVQWFADNQSGGIWVQFNEALPFKHVNSLREYFVVKDDYVWWEKGLKSGRLS